MTPPTEDNHLLRIGLAQIAPVWLDRERTILKVKTYVERASHKDAIWLSLVRHWFPVIRSGWN
jgi:hypothetical protein